VSTCPVCGQPVPDVVTPVVDLQHNTVSYGGKIIKLSPREAEVVWALCEGPLDTDALVIKVWGRFAEGEAAAHVYISRLRTKLPQIGLTIRGSGRTAYMIEALSDVAPD
jgi:DNA-binding response OmpR family regulator